MPIIPSSAPRYIPDFPVSALRVSSLNPRQHTSAAQLEELAGSIKDHGIQQPLIVRWIVPATGKEITECEIVCGHRRYQCAVNLKLTSVPILVQQLSDDQAQEIAIVDNLQREDIPPMDEAEALESLAARIGTDHVARRIHKSEAYVIHRLQLCQLIPKAKEALRLEKIALGHAQELARLSDKDQEDAYKHLFLGWTHNKGAKPATEPQFDVREFRNWIRHQLHLRMESAPFKLDDAALVPAAGPCSTCPKRSTVNQVLFADLAADKEDVCTDRECFQAKTAAHIERVQITTKEKTGSTLPAPPKNGTYTEVLSKKNRCPHTYTVLVPLDSSYSAGKVLDICAATKTCKIHFPSYSQSSSPTQKKERDTRKLEQSIRAAILKQVSEQIPEKQTLGNEPLEWVAAAGVLNCDEAIASHFCAKFRLIDTGKEKKPKRHDVAQAWYEHLEKGKATAGQITYALIYDSLAQAAEYERADGPDLLVKAATFYGVDHEAISKELTGAAEAKAAKKAKPGRPAGSKNPPGHKAGRPPKVEKIQLHPPKKARPATKPASPAVKALNKAAKKSKKGKA